MPVQRPEECFRQDASVGGVNTSGVVQSLRPDPLGRNLYHIRDEENGLEYHVRANRRSEAWAKVREHKQNGVYVNTGACTITGGDPANANAPEFGVTAIGG